MQLFIQALIAGLTSGAVYALIALGLVITYKTTRVINLAHGESLIVCACVVSLLDDVGLPLAVSAIGGVTCAAGFAMFVQQVLLQPRTHWHIGQLILITVGVAFAMQGVMRVVMGASQWSIPAFVHGAPISVAGATLSMPALLLIVSALVVCLLVVVLLRTTSLGKSLEASAEDPAAAALMGISVVRVRLGAAALAGALAGVAAVLFVPLSATDYQHGLTFTLLGFVAAATGGLTSTTVAVLGGLALGVMEAVTSAYLSTLYRSPVVFLLLILLAVVQSRNVKFAGTARA